MGEHSVSSLQVEVVVQQGQSSQDLQLYPVSV